LYNPDGHDLKEGGDPFLSLVAGARDLAAHGARRGDWWTAAEYWHSSKDPEQVLQYVATVGARHAGSHLFFQCLNRP